MNYLVDECFRAEVEKYRWNRLLCGHWQARRGELRGTQLHQYVWRLSGRPSPVGELSIDHINGDPSDNRLENLRLATRRLQCLNRRCKRTKSTLPRGVAMKPWLKEKPYQARTCNRHLGCYATPGEASAAYEAEIARQIEIEEARVKEIIHAH